MGIQPLDVIRGRRKRSEPLGPQQRVGQVKQEAERNEAGEGIIEDHGRLHSKPLTGIGVADREREEADGHSDHENVKHEENSFS